MLIHHDETGFIDHIRSDPESQEIINNFLAEGGWIHLAPIPLPAIAVRDNKGKLVIEDGKVKREVPGYTQPVATHDFHYVVDGRVVERPTLPSATAEIKADGTDAFVLDELPMPCTFLVDGSPVVIEDGKLEFATTDAGTYVFESVFPFVDCRIKVTAR